MNFRKIFLNNLEDLFMKISEVADINKVNLLAMNPLSSYNSRFATSSKLPEVLKFHQAISNNYCRVLA